MTNFLLTLILLVNIACGLLLVLGFGLFRAERPDDLPK